MVNVSFYTLYKDAFWTTSGQPILKGIMEEVQTLIDEIITSLGLDYSIKSYGIVAKKLSVLTHRDKDWTAKYIHSVRNQYKGIYASPNLKSALAELLYEIGDIMPNNNTHTSNIVTLLNIPDGTVLPNNAKIVLCARPGCSIQFIRVHPRQIYHSTICAQMAKKNDRNLH